MKSEQLFQIDRQIGQIRKGIEQRQEKIAEWNVPLASILNPCRTPDAYLSKKYSDSRISYYQGLTEGSAEQARKLMQKNLSRSRMRIRGHRNELKQLDMLIKKRNVIRVLKLKEESSKQNKKPLITLSKVNTPPKKQSRMTYDGNEKIIARSEKEHSFMSNVKGEKILEIYQERKNRGASGEEAAAVLKKQLGLGIENTPFYYWMERKYKEEKTVTKSKSSTKLGLKEKPKAFPFFKSMEGDFRPRKNIYLKSRSNIAQNFQHRLLNIIRYHQHNFNSLLH